MAAKTKTVALYHINFALLRLVEGKVQPWIERRVVGKMVNGWWYYVVLQSQY